MPKSFLKYRLARISVAAISILIFGAFAALPASAEEQIINLSSSPPSPGVGDSFTVTAEYDVSDGDNSLTGIELFFHYDSSQVSFINCSNINSTNSQTTPSCADVIEDHSDGDPSTDRQVQISWADVLSPEPNWPGQTLPLDLLDLHFTMDSAGTTSINVTAKTAARQGVPVPESYLFNGGESLSYTVYSVIPLNAGWNLISFNVNQFFYWGDTVPDVPMLSGIETVRVNSIDDVLTSINGKYEIVSSFDKDGAHTYDPALAGFSDLKYLAAGYGYWIKMTEAADLILPGGPASTDAMLALNTGWNLVGCWHPDAQYVGVEPAVSLPYGTQAAPVGSIDTVFGTISGAYEIISSFDENGAHTYDPALSGFSDLKYVAPGYGYWIKMTHPRNLSY